PHRARSTPGVRLAPFVGARNPAGASRPRGQAKEGKSMRRAVGILTIAVVPVFVAALALAADPYGSSGTSATHRQETGATSGTSGTHATGFMGEHTMTGRITEIDKDKGRVTVDSEGEELDLHFPKSALQNMNKGDQVTVSLAIKPA